jgi:CheY-like chemotaxis protein
MDWSVTMLVLGVLVLAFGVYVVQTVIRPSGGTLDVALSAKELRFKVTSADRDLARGDLKAASVERGQHPDPSKEEELARVETVRRTRVLWVDDRPEGNVHERRMLERLHADIELADSTDAALQLLVGREYELIITDLTRVDRDGVDDREAGLDLLRFLAAAPGVSPVIVYAGRIDDRAAQARALGARAVTDDPNVLLGEALQVLRA